MADNLFTHAAEEHFDAFAPLAARMRPRSLDELVGQSHLVGPAGPLRSLISADRLGSIVLWGPAGTGKTSLAGIVASASKARFVTLSAVSGTVADVRKAIAEAKEALGANGRKTILFIDEIHRFNKAQQDALLPAVERGEVTLIGATTENPYFSVNSPLLSRSLVFRLEPLSRTDVVTLLERALRTPIAASAAAASRSTTRRSPTSSTGPGATPGWPSMPWRRRSPPPWPPGWTRPPRRPPP